MSATIVLLPDQATAKLPRKTNLYRTGGICIFAGMVPEPLTENFVKIPVMDHEAYDCEWLANKTQYEVQTVG